jgi:hypothetical protein
LAQRVRASVDLAVSRPVDRCAMKHAGGVSPTLPDPGSADTPLGYTYA